MRFRKCKSDLIPPLHKTLKCFPSFRRKFKVLRIVYEALLEFVSSSASFLTTTCLFYFAVVILHSHCSLNMQDLCICSPFIFLTISSARCKHGLVGHFIQVSPQKGLPWLPYLEHQIALMATWYYIVYLFECFLHYLSKYVLLWFGVSYLVFYIL